jgi:hypothetical protein
LISGWANWALDPARIMSHIMADVKMQEVLS